MARRDEQGYIHLVDRKSNMIISGGENIYPSEVESVLAAHPAVQDVAVVGLPDGKWGEAVHAVIVLRLRTDGRRDGDEDWCRARMAGYKRPRGYHFVGESEIRARRPERSSTASCGTAWRPPARPAPPDRETRRRQPPRPVDPAWRD